MANSSGDSFLSPPVYIFRLPQVPRSQRLVFEEALSSAVSAHTKQLLQPLSGQRDMLRQALEAGSGIVKSVDTYLPGLMGLMTSTEQHAQTMLKLLKVQWTPPFSKRNQQWFAQPSLQWERLMVLVAYAVALRNLARETLLHGIQAESSSVSLTQSTTGPGSPASPLASEDAKLKEAARLLTTAAAVFVFIAEKELTSYALKPEFTLPELTSDFHMAMSQLCMAEACALSVKKAFLANTNKSLCSKLAADAAEKFSAAHQAISGLRAAVLEDLQLCVRRYAQWSAQCWQATALRLSGLTNYEERHYGAAIRCMRDAEKKLEGDQRDPDLADYVNTTLVPERNECQRLAAQWAGENDRIYFELVPDEAAQMPEPKSIVKVGTFSLPAPGAIDVQAAENSACCIM
jgi:hypothetical protein